MVWQGQKACHFKKEVAHGQKTTSSRQCTYAEARSSTRALCLYGNRGVGTGDTIRSDCRCGLVNGGSLSKQTLVRVKGPR